MKNIRLGTFMVSMGILFSHSSIAQNTTFQLSDYKNPDYLYQTLDLNFALSNALSYNNLKSTNDYNQSQYSLNSNLGGTYSSYANSLRSQTEKHFSLGTAIGLNGSYNKMDYINSMWESKNRLFSNNDQLALSELKRFYNEKQNYFEVNVSLNSKYDGSFNRNKTIYTGSSDTLITSNQNSFSNNVAGAFLIGKGRIEQVQDARMALYLLNDLNQLNRDIRPASDEDVLALARLITSLKYKRFFDSRLQKIAEITAIDSFLQGRKIAGVTDAAYFTSLNDNWNFSNNPVRNSGRRLFTGIQADLNHNYDWKKEENRESGKILSEMTDKSWLGSIFLVAGLNYEKPISLRWQKSANLKASLGTSNQLRHHKVSNLTSESDYKTFSSGFPYLKLSADYGYGYYPNSRTWLTANWQLSAGYIKWMNGTSGKDKSDYMNNFNVSTGPVVQAYYYLSEKLRFSLAFSGRFYYWDDKFTYDEAPEGTKDTNWSHTLNASLTYSLF